MTTLHILQSIWGMDGLRDTPDSDIFERMRLIRNAGFDGIAAHFHARTEVETWISQAKDHGFVIEGQAFPTTLEDLLPALDLAAEHGIHHLALQPDLRTDSIEDAAALLSGWQLLGRDYGVPVMVETHRNRLTTDLWATCAMIDRVPGLPLVADLSHYVVGQEITLPVIPRNCEKLERVLAQAGAFHGRIATSGQVQVELGTPIHQPWVEFFFDLWEEGFRSWRAKAPPEASLTFVCELGPQPYAIAGPDGRDLSDRWQDAQDLRDRVAKLWNRIAAEPA